MEFNIENIHTVNKLNIIEFTVEEAYVLGTINPMILKILFDVNCILMFTDLEFTPEEKTNKLELYDRFVEENLFIEFRALMPEGLADELWEYTQEYASQYIKYQNSFAGFIDKFQYMGEDMMKNLAEGLKGMNLEALPQVKEVAEELGVIPKTIKE